MTPGPFASFARLLLAGTLGLAVFCGVCLWLDGRGLLDTSENGTLEVGQMILLGLGTLAWLQAAIARAIRPDTGDAEVLRRAAVTFAGFAAIACWIVLGRESSWGSEYAVADDLSDQLEMAGFTVAGAAVLLSVGYWILKVPDKHDIAKRLLLSRSMQLLVLALVFAAAGAFFDREIIEFKQYRVLEEAAEFWAYLFPIAARFALPTRRFAAR